MDIDTSRAEKYEENWINLNTDVIEGKSDFYDPVVFENYLREGLHACHDVAGIYKAGSLSQFTENVMVETAKGTDHSCLIKSQKILSFIDSPIDELDVSLDAIKWEGLEGAMLSAILGICKNMKLNCLSKLKMPESPVDQAKLKIFKGETVQGPPHKHDKDPDKMTLRTLAITLGDGTITGELDLEGKSLEGANTNELAKHIISLFRSIEHKYLAEGSPFHEVINKTLVEAMIRKLEQAIRFQSLLRALAAMPGGYDVYENTMIDRIRQMEIDDDVLMMVQITDHAITLSIKKTGPRLVEVLLFNSGFGLEHHSSVEIGSRNKHFPARRYVDIPLGVLKSLGIIKKVAELSAIVGKMAPAIDKRVASNYTPEDLYQCALAPLNDYAYQFTVEDVETYRLIPAQRSGTCAYKCYWAYFAFNLGESFRPLKLLTTKEGIDRAMMTNWNENEKPVARRLLKFGMENYARSVLRYRKCELKNKKLNIKLFGDRKFWRVYHQVRHQMGIIKPRSFSARQLSTFTWRLHLSSLRNNSAISLFHEFDEMEGKMELPQAGEKYELPLKAPKDQGELMAQIDSLLQTVQSEVWNLSSNTEKLVLITSYINDLLPTPTRDADFWDSVFLGNLSDEPVLKKLFELLVRMLMHLKEENYIYPSSYLSILKMLSIYHKAMMIVEPKFGGCFPFLDESTDENMESHYNDVNRQPGSSSDWEGIFSAQYMFINMDVFSNYEKIIKFTTDNNRVADSCGAQYWTANSIHGKYLSRYVDIVKWDQLGNIRANKHDEKLKYLHAARLDDSILPHHYFWRDAINFFKTVSAFENVPDFAALKEDYNLYTGCDVNDEEVKCKSSGSSPCRHTFYYEATKLAYQPSMFSGIEGASIPPFKHLTWEFSDFSSDIKKRMEISGKEMPLYLNNTFGVLGGFERLSTLLMNDDDRFDWRTYLTLGTHSVAQIDPEKVSPELTWRTFEFVDQVLQKNMKILRGQLYKISNSGSRDPMISTKVRKISALLILEAQIATKAQILDAKSILSKRITEFFELFHVEETSSDHMAYLSFAYILAHQGLALTVESSRRIILLNQKLTESLKVLDNETDSRTYLFEIREIVFRAVKIIMEAGEPEIIKGCAVGKVSETDVVKAVFPFVEIGTACHINLLSGESYLDGSRLSDVQISEIEQLFNSCKYDPGSLKFVSSKSRIKKNRKMVTLVVNPLTAKVWSRPDGTQITLITIKILNHYGSEYLVEEYDDGSLYYYQWVPKDDWQLISVPATDDSEKLYNIFQRPTESEPEYLFQHKDISIWFSENETFDFNEPSLRSLKPVVLDEGSKGALENPLASADTMAVFKSRDSYFALFKYYSDHSGRPLWIQQDQQTFKWHLHFDSKYQVSHNQSFIKSEYLHNFLVVQNHDGSVRKCVLPMEHYQIETKKKQKAEHGYEEDYYDYVQSSGSFASSDGGKKKDSYKLEFSRKNFDVLKSTVLMSMTADGHLKPSSRFEHLLLAYKFLAGREYLDAFNHLLKVHQIEPFSPSELRLFGWIMVSFTAMRDGSPESVAIRAYAAYLVFANDRLFGLLRDFDASLKGDEDELAPGPYDPDEKWIDFWEENVTGKPCYKVAESYFDVRANIPVALRFEFKSGRDLMTNFEEKTWLEALLHNAGNTSRANITAYLNPLQDHVSVDSSMIPIQINRATVSENAFKYKDALAHRKMAYDISSFHPENFESRVYKLFNHFMFGNYSEYEVDQYCEHLLSLKNTKFADLAAMLLSALKNRKSRKIPQQCENLHAQCSKLPNKYSWEYEAWRIKCVSLYEDCFTKSTKQLKLHPTGIKRSTLMFPKIFDEDIPGRKIPEGPLNTPNIKPEACGDYVNLNEFKEALLSLKLDDSDVIEMLTNLITEREEKLKKIMQELQSSINMAFEKATKTPLEVKIRRIAKGRRTIDEQDILHLYTNASKRRYYQYYPDVPDSAYQVIHGMCTDYAVTLADLNDMKRLAKVINNKEKDEAAWLLEVKKRRCRTTSTDNVILAYEIFIDSRLTKRQYYDIKDLTTKKGTSYVNKVIQRMMSAGKTFILGTILSNLKADGENLSVLVVPRSLYSSEASSLISRTFNAFGTAGFSFKFSRESSKKIGSRLEWIAEAMETARKQGKYMIVVPELILTLLNRFTEIVLHESKSEQSLQEFVPLQKILKLLRDHGAATFDEIDMIFDPTQELNFPLNSTRHDSDDDDRYFGVMLSELYFTLLDKDIVRIADIRSNIVIEPEIYKKIRMILITKMVDKLLNQNLALPFESNEGEPVLMLNRLGLHDKLNEFFHVPSVSSDMVKRIERHAGIILDEISNDSLTRSILSMLRLAINEWVLASWTGNVNENYGVSSKTPYAIPYANAGVAKEGSEFSFRWLTYARTQRMYLVLGLDRPRLADSIQWLQDWATEDIENNITSDESLAVTLSRGLFGKDPATIDARSNEEMDLHLSHLKAKQDTIEYLKFLLLWTGRKVIPTVKFYESQISANAQDFFMMFDSYQGYSGTLATVKTLPPVFHPKGAIELQQKIEDQIEAKIRADKVHEIISIPENWEVLNVPVGLASKDLWQLDHVATSIEAMEKAGHPLNAIIDVGAYFKDESNEAVAESMLKLKPNVLYFSTKLNKLAVKTSNDKEKMIETISRASLEDLGIDDKDRITLYDQQHCTGVDIFQHDRGFALVIIGLKTTTRDFNQAIMRMRKYLEGQKIVILLPDNVSKVIKSPDSGITVDNVLAFLHMNMRAKVVVQNSLAMGHILRTLFKNPVYELLISNPLDDTQYCKAYGIWVKGTEIPLDKQILPQESLEFTDYMKRQIFSHEQSVFDCLGAYDADDISIEARRILTEAAEDAPNDYPNEVIVSAIEDNDQMIENEVESSRQMDLENENEMETQAVARPINGDSIPLDFELNYFPHCEKIDGGPYLILLKDLFEERLGFAMMNNFISREIYISAAFMKHLFGMNRSCVFYILWLEKEGEDPIAAIINSFEAQVVKRRLEKEDEVFGYKAWLLTSTGIQCQLRKTAPTINKKIIAEVLIFGGLTKILESPEWIPYFEEWLGTDGQVKSVIYRGFVLGEAEGRQALKGPLGNLLKVDESWEKQLLGQPQYQVLNVMSSKTKKVQKYIDKLIKAEDPWSFDVAMKLTSFSIAVGPETYRLQVKACIKKGIDLLVKLIMKKDDTFVGLESWEAFTALAPYMDEDDYIYVLRKSNEISHFDDCQNQNLFGVLFQYLKMLEGKVRTYTPELIDMSEHLNNSILQPFNSYEMAMAEASDNNYW